MTPAGFFSNSEMRSGSLPDCPRCRLHEKCLSPKMEPYGKDRQKILIVGDMPREQDDQAGVPFAGPDGDLLRSVFAECGVDLYDCSLTNAIACRAYKEEMRDKYLVHCRPHIQRLLDERKFSVIIPLGSAAVQQVMPEFASKYGSSIYKWRGWAVPDWSLGAWVCPAIHPHDVLQNDRNPTQRQIFINDIKRALEKRTCGVHNYPTKDEMESLVDVVLDKKDAQHRLRSLAKQEGILSFDFETTGLKPEYPDQRIISCAFCLDGNRAWSCMIDKEEMLLLGDVLFSKKLRKVAANLKYEERYTRFFFRRGVSRWYWDTMLMAHCLDNRGGISSLKFQSAARLGVGLWDDGILPYMSAVPGTYCNQLLKAPREELLLYGGLDALLTYHVMVHQKKEMINNQRRFSQ